jgi:hypothetical protein
MNAPRRTHWSDLVPVAALDRIGELFREARELGKRPRSILTRDERDRLDLVELQLDDLVAGVTVAAAAVELPGLVAAAVDSVRTTRALQRYERRTLCPVTRRELPRIVGETVEVLDQLGDVVAAVTGGELVTAGGEGGAP